jgi:cytochrome c-type biogenesis protein CcmH/NrfG
MRCGYNFALCSAHGALPARPNTPAVGGSDGVRAAEHRQPRPARTPGRILAAVILIALTALFAGCSANPDVAKRKYVENGNKYFARGKYREASILYRSAIKKDPRYGEAYYRLGLTELRREQISTAAYAFRRAVELQPDNEDAKVQLANIYLLAYAGSARKSEDLAKEIQALVDRILKRNPDSFQASRILGQLALLRRDYQEAQTHFEKAEKLSPGDPDVIVGYCQVLYAWIVSKPVSRWPGISSAATRSSSPSTTFSTACT